MRNTHDAPRDDDDHMRPTYPVPAVVEPPRASSKRRPGGQEQWAGEWGDQIRDEIIQRLADGESLIAICRTPGYPSESRVRTWVVEDLYPPFAARYARARDLWNDHQAEIAIELADTAFPDFAAVAKAKLQIETRKWITSKLAPKRYGDKLQVDAGFTVTATDRMSDAELDKEIQSRMAALAAMASPIPTPQATPAAEDEEGGAA